MDARNGIVRRSVNLDWHDLPLRSLLEECFDLPVYVANDSQVAALGEYTFGNRSGVENLVVIKVGHGADADPNSLLHQFAVGPGEITIETICRALEPLKASPMLYSLAWSAIALAFMWCCSPGA